MGSSNIYTAGLNNVGSYQVSGQPYLSGAIDARDGTLAQLDFPAVTRWIQISNSGSSVLNYSFSQLGPSTTPGNMGIVFPDSTTPRMEVKVTQLFLTGGVDGGVFVAAGLTNLPVSRINNISPSGSNWSGSSGVG
tara:strand:- start:72 stop:476 length:405 start_codon:yes stop_codon:yes gene_type:complete